MNEPSNEIEFEFHFDDYKNRQAYIRQQERFAPSFRARLASTLVERWGIVAATSDGEDSAGRRVLRALTPEELVTKACETADRAVTEFHSRGWMQEAPTLASLKAFREGLDDEGGSK